MKLPASVTFAVAFATMAVAALIAVSLTADCLTVRVLLIWATVSLALVATAYAMRRPSFLMKRNDGRRPLLAALLLWPYFLLAHLAFVLYRISSRKQIAFAEAASGLWFSRRLTREEFLKSGVSWRAILDLAAELPRIDAHVQSYSSCPLLDGIPPSDSDLETAIQWIDQHVHDGPVLVHCALGHGRTGCVITAWLLVHAHFPDVQAAIAHLRSLRPTFGMSSDQAAAIATLVKRRSRNTQLNSTESQYESPFPSFCHSQLDSPPSTIRRKPGAHT